jgi:hypothetical protein
MRVDLGGCNRGMPKELLYVPNIRSIAQKVSSERMPKGMRGNIFGNTSLHSPFFDDSLHCSGCKS